MAVTKTSRWWRTLSLGGGTRCSTCRKRLPRGVPIVYRARPKRAVLCSGCAERAGVRAQDSYRLRGTS